jgi:predicted amidohydrolase
VNDGTVLGEIALGELSVLVLICADFWFSDVFYRCKKAPDVVLVPALSVTRKPTPHYSRALWEHLAVSRAYEFGAYVGISDWAYRAWPLGVSPSGVSGFADPTAVEAEALFSRTSGDLAVHELDLGALASFRRDRMERGFFWKTPEPR